MAPGVLQEPDELYIRFRIEPVFHQSNREHLNGEPEQLHFLMDWKPDLYYRINERNIQIRSARLIELLLNPIKLRDPACEFHKTP